MYAMNRRHFTLGALGATLAAFVTGAGPTTARRRFLFVHAVGGWDPLCVFAPMFQAPLIDMEPDAEPATVGNFQLVASPSRPSVIPFFERWGDRTLLINGLSTRSVNHETCQVVALTGATSDAGVDWPTIVAASDPDAYYLPHLVLGGPAFAGDHTIYVSRAEGLVETAINGQILTYGDMPALPAEPFERQAVDAFLAARGTALASAHPDSAFASRYAAAQSRAHELVSADVVRFPETEGVYGQGQNAIRALADGVARCATISAGYDWDTHADNSLQSPLFDGLFSDLDALLELIATSVDRDGVTLADDTVVVVLSEMARTPAYNGTMGRDHWPYTSALVIGPGITGGRTIGGYTDLYAGIGVDPRSGERDPSRAGIDARAVGATLLALGGVDPADHIEHPEVIEGVLS